MKDLLRHLQAVRNVTLPGDYLPFRLGGQRVGYVSKAAAGQLATRGGFVVTPDEVALGNPADLAVHARQLAGQGLFPHRGEDFDLRATPGGPVLTRLDRGALPYFGIAAAGVHVNGLVHRPDGLHVWIGRRSADRLMDPGKLDHLCAGGIPAGMGAAETLIKEGDEEAGLPAHIMASATPVGTLAYTMRRAEGLRRDRLHCYDLQLPETVIPFPRDGEITVFELWPIARVIETLRATDDFKFNVAVVLIGLLLRHGILPPSDPETIALRQEFSQLSGDAA